MNAPASPARLLAIGGLDPTGGAGLAVDARMAAALGVHALTVATCLTVQNRHGFTLAESVTDVMFGASLTAALDDGPVHAVKIGLVANPAILRSAVERCNASLPGVPIIVDPVLGSTSRGLVAPASLVASYRELLDRIAVLTPNLPELDRLAAGRVEDLLASGCGAVLLKGGHAEPEDGMIEDLLVRTGETLVMRHPYLLRGPIHGTGCALASALGARLARGETLAAAARGAVDDLAASIGRTPASGDGLAVPLVVVAGGAAPE